MRLATFLRFATNQFSESRITGLRLHPRALPDEKLEFTHDSDLTPLDSGAVKKRRARVTGRQRKVRKERPKKTLESICTTVSDLLVAESSSPGPQEW